MELSTKITLFEHQQRFSCPARSGYTSLLLLLHFSNISVCAFSLKVLMNCLLTTCCLKRNLWHNIFTLSIKQQDQYSGCDSKLSITKLKEFPMLCFSRAWIHQVLLGAPETSPGGGSRTHGWQCWDLGMAEPGPGLGSELPSPHSQLALSGAVLTTWLSFDLKSKCRDSGLFLWVKKDLTGWNFLKIILLICILRGNVTSDFLVQISVWGDVRGWCWRT